MSVTGPYLMPLIADCTWGNNFFIGGKHVATSVSRATVFPTPGHSAWILRAQYISDSVTWWGYKDWGMDPTGTYINYLPCPYPTTLDLTWA